MQPCDRLSGLQLLSHQQLECDFSFLISSSLSLFPFIFWFLLALQFNGNELIRDRRVTRMKRHTGVGGWDGWGGGGGWEWMWWTKARKTSESGSIKMEVIKNEAGTNRRVHLLVQVEFFNEIQLQPFETEKNWREREIQMLEDWKCFFSNYESNDS